MQHFRFVIDDNIFEFTSKPQHMDLHEYFLQNYPNMALAGGNLCSCIDRCDCQSGYVVQMDKWVSNDSQKPWLGQNITITTPLEIMRPNNAWTQHYND